MSQIRKREIWVDTLALILLSSVALLHAWKFRFSSIDDAYITYRYAENIAQGHGYVFNVGERVEGTSTFLLTLLLAMGGVFRADIEIAARCIGVASFVGVVYVVYIFVRKTIEGRFGLGLALASALMVASSTPLAFHAVLGMELLLYVLLLSAGVFGYLRNAQDARQSPHWMMWLALATATRTEALFVAITLLACVALRQTINLLGSRSDLAEGLRPTLAKMGRPLVELAAVVLPLLLFRKLYFGSWVPNSVTAKDGFFRELRALPLSDLCSRIAHEQGLRMVTQFGKERLGYLLVLIPLGLLSIRYRRQTATFLLVGTILMSVVIWNNGDWMPHWRLLAPLIPFACVAVASTLSLIHVSARLPRWVGLFPWVMAMATFAYGIDRSFYIREAMSKPNQVANYMLDLGRALAATQKGNEVLATDMAGRVPYTSRLYTVDMFGLCDTHIARYGTATLHMGKIDHAYVYRKRPDFYFYNLTYTVRAMILSQAFQPYVNDYWVVTTRFAAETANRHGKILLARKDLPRLDALVRQLSARLVSPQTL